MNESLFRISLMKLDFTSQREQHVLNCLGCLNFYKVEIKMSCKINYINTELYFKILNVMSNQLYNSKKLVINSYKLSRRVKRFWHPRKTKYKYVPLVSPQGLCPSRTRRVFRSPPHCCCSVPSGDAWWCLCSVLISGAADCYLNQLWCLHTDNICLYANVLCHLLVTFIIIWKHWVRIQIDY